MDIEAGKPVFIEELVEQSGYIGQTVRATGTLHSYNPTTDRASLADGQYAVLIDTRLLGVMQYHIGQTYQFIGVVASAPNEAAPELFDDARCSLSIVLQARVAREVDGLDMAVYRKSVAALRRFLDGTEEAQS
ncbi:hypothetical protein GGI25_003842 [Coemansia spiralis]|uniref:Uncharacterized protein n=2 Tax=Coemansia TaxID=4863 RepID=A0A9W8G593_9FUNG|nr:telomere-capping, CST complex subunit-domain-containing protein [Coemansia spiralis]KAJ1990989.1 hypothetical protein EDC05_003709 [Coemansia umbellata]KAJ2620999.1 hypothetical protein GGI26_004499 [Coemansia sp. RSA 1358]KAJ2675748.1 hypothetical protein GGI25_003842 [Coemansia spiralis]